VRNARRHPDKPVLITEARTSGTDSFDARKKKYTIMMVMRGVCVIGAAFTVHISGWFAAAFVAAALVLPWTAVLIANDRPPKETVRFRRFMPGGDSPSTRQLTAGSSASGPEQGTSHQQGAAESPTGPTVGPTITVIDI
jgi:hypothetical protein